MRTLARAAEARVSFRTADGANAGAAPGTPASPDGERKIEMYYIGG